MSLLKYIDRLKRMDDLIRRKATGTPDQFAEKLGLHRSVLMDNLREMRELGASISFCNYRKSYVYDSDFKLIIGKRSDTNSVKGGCFLEKRKFELISNNLKSQITNLHR